MGAKPNIIFITADQLAASCVGCYDSGVPSTPNLDKLAAEGMKFDRNYATVPLCAPNRATLLTGRSPEIHGIISNNYALQTDNPTYAHVLREHGYRLGGFGKFHQTPMRWPVPDNVRFLGFDESIVSEDPKWGPWIDWVKETYPEYADIAIAMTNSHGGSARFSPEFEMLQGATREETEIKKAAFRTYMEPVKTGSLWERMYASPLPAEAHDTTFLTNASLDFIRICRDDRQKPFFCHISYVDPHDPYDPPAPYDTMFNPDDMPEPLAAEWVEQGPHILDADRDNYLKFRLICGNADAIKKLRALYHGSLAFMDGQIGKIIDEVKASGLWEQTVIIFTTDHGDMVGDHGLIAKGVSHYDKGIRCPLIVAGGPVRRGRTDRLTCSLDFFPSFCEWAGIDPRHLPPLEGKSFVGVCNGEAEEDPWKELSVAIADIDTVITNDRFRLTLYSASGEGQMFDLDRDPSEQRNLYHLPEYREKKIKLLERLVKARSRPRTIPQYRNLPVRNGRKYLPDSGSNESVPFIRTTGSPWLEDGTKPEWRSNLMRKRGDEQDDEIR